MRHASRRLLSSALVAAAAVAALPAAAQAQGLGIKGGISYNNVTSSGALPGDEGEQTGFTGGIGFVTGGFLGVGVEALYAQRNAASSTATGKLTFVDIPAYLRVRIPTPMLAPYVYAGPQWSREIGCTVNGADCAEDAERTKTSTSAVIGGGLQLGKHGLSVEGRYVYGLSDLNFGTVSNTENYKSRTFVLLLGLGF